MKRGRPRLVICIGGLHRMTKANRLNRGGCRACNNAASRNRYAARALEYKARRLGVAA